MLRLSGRTLFPIEALQRTKRSGALGSNDSVITAFFREMIAMRERRQPQIRDQLPQQKRPTTTGRSWRLALHDD